MVNGMPDWNRFQATYRGRAGQAPSRAEDAGICAYGEMVGVLWQEGEYDAAILLEEFWNRLLHGSGITLFCGISHRHIRERISIGAIAAVRRAHTHMISAGCGRAPVRRRSSGNDGSARAGSQKGPSLDGGGSVDVPSDRRTIDPLALAKSAARRGRYSRVRPATLRGSQARRLGARRKVESRRYRWEPLLL